MADPTVMHDPTALAVIKAVEWENCRRLVREYQSDRVAYFARRIAERGLTAVDVVIVVINVDMSLGAELADVLMPNHDWAAIRARGEIPYARGLVTRDGIEDLVDRVDPDAGVMLRAIAGVAVVVVDRGVVAAFPLAEVS